MSMRKTAVVLAMAVVMLAGGGRRAFAAPDQDAPRAAAPALALNLNVATAEDLQKLPGIGAATAARILEYRQKSGGFKKVEELMNVKGIGEKNFLKLKNLVIVSPKTADR